MLYLKMELFCTPDSSVRESLLSRATRFAYFFQLPILLTVHSTNGELRQIRVFPQDTVDKLLAEHEFLASLD